ncbi:MAG: 3-oxoadipate enol-lactonase [Candidatus Azotimanducaceae bacterium]
MPFIKTEKIALYYEVAGDGAPVLYLSGSGADLRTKNRVLDGPLPNSMKVISYDQRGLGQSDKPAGPYTMSQYADDAANLLDELEFDRVHVIGVSFGGMVAQHFALRHADRIDRLVLCCTSAGGESMSYPFHKLPVDIDPIERLKTMMGISDLRCNEQWQIDNPDKVQAMIKYTQNNQIADHETSEYKRGANLQLLARAEHDLCDSLGKINMPTLICAGKYDGIAPASNQEFLISKLPNASLRWFEGGHIFLAQDKSAWPAISDFLSQ